MFTNEERRSILLSCAVIFIVSILLPFIAHAEIPDRYTNQNMFAEGTTHDRPVTFELDGHGGFAGYTQLGKVFRQYPVLPDSGVRLHRFEIGEAFFFVSDRGVIQAPSNIAALSIYHTLS
jgi:hypothetical protein